MFNKSQIMRRAHEIIRQNFGGKVTRHTLRFALQDAWAEAKREVAQARKSAEVIKLQDAINLLECKDHWTRNDHAKMDRLRVELREAA